MKVLVWADEDRTFGSAMSGSESGDIMSAGTVRYVAELSYQELRAARIALDQGERLGRCCCSSQRSTHLARRVGPPGQTSERDNYWLIATPLKAATPIGLDVAAEVRSP